MNHVGIFNNLRCEAYNCQFRVEESREKECNGLSLSSVLLAHFSAKTVLFWIPGPYNRSNFALAAVAIALAIVFCLVEQPKIL